MGAHCSRDACGGTRLELPYYLLSRLHTQPALPGPLPFSSTHRTDCDPGKDCAAVYNEQPHTAALAARQCLELVSMGLANATLGARASKHTQTHAHTPSAETCSDTLRQNEALSSLSLLCCCSVLGRHPASSTYHCCAAHHVRLRGLAAAADGAVGAYPPHTGRHHASF